MAAKEADLLFAAADRGDATELRRLLATGADASVLDSFGATALMRASQNGRPECVELLLPVSDALVRDRYGQTALMWAAVGGSARCVELLLPVSDARARNVRGLTAACHARAVGSESVSALLESYERSQAERYELERHLEAVGAPPARARKRI